MTDFVDISPTLDPWDLRWGISSVGKRLVLIKSVRALRMAAGSYGLAWSLWRWHQESNNDKQEVAVYGESVVRLAPVNSPLSRASRRKHGEHIVTVPVSTENWKKNEAVNTVNWEAVGIQLEDEEAELRRVKVIEVELCDSEKTTVYAGRLKTQASKGEGAVCSVAVLPMSGSFVPMSVVNSFDVYFNPLSAVLKFIASEVKEHIDDESTVNELAGNENVFFIAESLSAGQAAASQMVEQGLVSKEKACFVVEDSLCGQSLPSEMVQAKSELLEMVASSGMEVDVITEQQGGVEEGDDQTMATIFSVADVTDQTLQGIRTLVRLAKKPNVIQAAVYEAYGAQRVVIPTRVDQFSDLHV
eukprot:jgi/Phyca11/533472/estExt2_fgenesh1_pg.C_PHYCAscaffold_140042